MTNVIIYLYISTHGSSILFTNSRSDQSHRSVSAISYENNWTCFISDNFCRTIKSCTTFNVTDAIKTRLSDISLKVPSVKLISAVLFQPFEVD